ncbi:hypothetical protein [Macellibacteroides fermentans]|uniref:Fimbrillin family protein n=1 Tax=Macellibacteroides fermentans TaxID=879969 RepID=A0A8E2A869_9PORP|nr:hypothetical protein [Macellibacteroides fermentans]NYI50666.1 hypothetical protein [Macellibacteroides fermentans]
MKKKLLSMFSILLLLSSCSTQDEPELTPPLDAKTYTVSFGLTGEITSITDSPLTRAVSNDLYGIQVYSIPDSTFAGGTYQSEKPYAYGIFDDKAKMSIKLMAGYKYRFVCTMLVDAKSRLPYYGSYYNIMPFNISGNNSQQEFSIFNYSTYNYFFNLQSGYTQLSASIGDFFGYRPNVDRYYGETINYVPTKDSTVTINMNRMVFGAKFVAEGMESGKLYIQIQDAPLLTLEAPNTEVQDIFTFSSVSYPGWDDPMTGKYVDYYEDISVSINWLNADSVKVPIATQNIRFTRNKLTTIKVRVQDSTMANSIGIITEDKPMVVGDTISIGGGSSTDTPINPVP